MERNIDGDTDRGATGITFGFHFAGIDHEEAKAVRARLSALAGTLGYVSRRGAMAGQGNAAALILAIARGEVSIGRGDPRREGEGPATPTA